MQTSDAENATGASGTDDAPRKHGKLRKVLGALLAIAVVILINVGLTLAFEPYGSYAELKWYLYRQLEPGSIDTLIVGSSYAQLCLHPAAIDEGLGSTSFNMGMPAQSLDNSLVAIKQAYEDHGIKRVILATSINTMIQKPWSYPSITFTQGKCKGESLFEQLGDWWNLLTDPNFFGTDASLHAFVPWTVHSVDKTPTAVWQNIQNRLNGDIIAAARWVDPKLWDNGQGFWCAEYSGNLNWVGRNVTAKGYLGKDFYAGNVEALNEIGSYCQENGIELVVVSVPRPDFEVLAYGEQYPEQMQEFEDIVTSYGGVLIDGTLYHDDIYSPPETDFMDKEHLSNTGAARFGRVLGGTIAYWEDEGSLGEVIYGFDEWDEYCESVDGISLTNYDFVIEDGRIVVTATSYAESGIEIEYAWFYTDKPKDGTVEVIREWSDSPELIIETDGHGMTDYLWVYARQKGSTEDEKPERYYAQQIRY